MHLPPYCADYRTVQTAAGPCCVPQVPQRIIRCLRQLAYGHNMRALAHAHAHTAIRVREVRDQQQNRTSQSVSLPLNRIDMHRSLWRIYVKYVERTCACVRSGRHRRRTTTTTTLQRRPCAGNQMAENMHKIVFTRHARITTTERTSMSTRVKGDLLRSFSC